MKLALTAAATVLVTAALVLGILYAAGMLTLSGVPNAITEACRTFLAAYDDADAQAQHARQGHLDTEWADAGPTASSEWQTKHQAALEAAALDVQDVKGEWADVAWQLVNAATVMKPEALTSMVDRAPALQGAHAACLGR
ncbi:hypothetical protein [Nonomuraea sp. CA-141351]|uniref:hypothetical protein n=1 Tax=Nonomuraea sp. CA-141351 TaxID=3239996 RepID=UPI003D8DD2D2